MSIESYRSLLVWQKSVDFVVQVYQLLGKFPKNEQYGLTSQLQRAAVSIPSNIAEGKERQSDRDFAQFISIALGSLVLPINRRSFRPLPGYPLQATRYELHA